MNILAIGAHPDDIEFSCAGTLAKYTARGDRVVIATTTIAELGNFELGKAETTRVRQQEAADSAALIDAEYLPLKFEDNTVNPYNRDQQERFVDLVRMVKPDVIFTHHPQDYHTDHRNLPELVLFTAPLLGLAEWPTKHPAWDGSPAVFFMQTLAGAYFEPTHYVDISQTYAQKKAMLAKHASQVGFLQRYFNMDLFDSLEIQSRFWGLQAGVQYAEAFVRYRGYGRGNLTRHYLP